MLKKINRAAKTINKFFVQTFKNYKSMKAQLKKIFALLLFAICLAACGSTKVLVDKPASGTQTTITVTTNNPITTDVNPSLDMKGK